MRQVTGRLTRHPATLTEDDRASLKEVLARCPELDKAAGHVRDFGEILTDRLGSTLPTWIDAVDASRLPGLTGFALHLLRDLDAVTAGLTLDWSSGSIEGAVNRITKIKRQLYGRAPAPTGTDRSRCPRRVPGYGVAGPAGQRPVRGLARVWPG
ncbi:transposase [Streptomyces sviceus]|uniref:transposase n=1 Tax=Streptomyces sviceus TaxID=285530 RepID=UPI003825C9CC